MAFIKNEERKSLISKINQSYGFRKFLIAIELLAMIGFIIVTFLSLAGIAPQWFNKTGKTTEILPMGIGMVVWAIVVVLLGVICLILTLSLKSPKKVKAQMDKLQSSALSGKRVKKNQTATEIVEARTTIKEKKSKK